jgi:catechol 2,3-dioxygenase-like lactoylglutathione lyase family enzyme
MSELAQDFNAFKPQVLHVAYHVADIERALGFYVGLLGMKETMRIPLGKNKAEVILQFPESKSAGVVLMWSTDREKAKPIEQGEGYSRLVLRVSDLDTSLAHLVKHQTPVVTEATSFGNFKYAMVKDPDGYVIELIQFFKA